MDQAAGSQVFFHTNFDMLVREKSVALKKVPDKFVECPTRCKMINKAAALFFNIRLHYTLEESFYTVCKERRDKR